ncbi:MAG: alcohol dehydrogenase [Lautropia sp.]
MKAHAITCFCEPLQTVDRQPAEPQGTEVLIDVLCTGICHTDLHLQDGYYDLGSGKRLNLVDRGIHPPLIPGHEIYGRLAAKGPHAPIDDTAIGRNFLVYPWLGCGECAVCRRGDDNLCAKPSSIGVFRPGGYARQCMVPHPRYLVQVGSGDSGVAATLACSGLTAFSALNKIDIDRERDLLLIVGLGGVGLSAFNIARAMGYRRIAVADIDPAKRSQALARGALAALDPRSSQALATLSELHGVQAAVDFVGTRMSVEFGLAGLCKGGACVVVGLFGGDLTVALPTLVQRGITLRGSYVGSLHELKALVRLSEAGGIEPLPVEYLPFDEINTALARLRQGQVSGRLVLQVGNGPG